ncbi:hypothetical protein SAMN05216570_2413 [Dyella sp. OK004]|uniref:hypothetical protein n=1 Tax=Dyella sp. OK004 TaxID=1855292 RepID=UPI0008E6E713|nr:hypothetical protein [Dyella sp. OK004]SFS08492.1 hypothetical protein SAMN05216570_2413 [Dyella sp. OK004]
MKDSSTIIATLDRAIEHVDAIETLGASLAAGMHAGVVIPDHVQTLMAMMATQIREQLVELSVMLQGAREQRQGGSENPSPLYSPQWVASSETGNFGNYVTKSLTF